VIHALFFSNKKEPNKFSIKMLQETSFRWISNFKIRKFLKKKDVVYDKRKNSSFEKQNIESNQRFCIKTIPLICKCVQFTELFFFDQEPSF
jgi:hypothetical protein